MKKLSVPGVIALGSLALAALLGAGCGSSGTTGSSSSTTSTATTLASSRSTTTTGTSITLTATVSPTAATGTVTFYNGTTPLGTGTLSSGTATLTTSFSSAGTYSLTAVYGGSSTYATSTSSTVSEVVSTASLSATTTSLASSSSTTTTGTNITLTATVSPSAATGTVTFYSGTTSLGTGTLGSGTATLSTSFGAAGTYSITAVYGGSSTYATSTSSAVSVVVGSSSSGGNSTTIALTPSASTAYPGSLVIFTATVSPSTATGAVTFYEGASSLGSASLSSGTATLATHFSSTGAYKIAASYGGDSTYSSSTSSSVSETVESGSYSLDLSNYSCNTVTTTVATDTSHSVTYCLYSNVVYAANPVDATYESMNIYVPSSVDGTSVSGKPILFENSVGGYMSSRAGQLGTNGNYALGKGYVVVEPGCRGRDNGSSGDYYGVAPAAMVDLKAAIRFLRYNSSLGTFSGDVSHIVSSGGSAGGALSALVGASGNSSLYNSYLAAIGAADAGDNIFAVGAWSPITNLDHADMAYEEEYSGLQFSGSIVNSAVSSNLIAEFESYQDGLGLTDKRGSMGTLTSSNIAEYILEQYMEPSLLKYVNAGGTAPSYATCTSAACAFTFSNYVNNSIGTRGKSAPAFDSFFDMTSSSTYYNTVVNTACQPETMEFGNPTGTTAYSGSNCSGGSPRHFTNFSSQAMDGASISGSMQTVVNMMNPMYFIMNAISSGNSSGVAKYWYIRDGAIATDTSAYIIVDLATAAENLLGTSYVNAWEDWGQGHNVETDPSGFSTWVTNSVAAN